MKKIAIMLALLILIMPLTALAKMNIATPIYTPSTGESFSSSSAIKINNPDTNGQTTIKIVNAEIQNIQKMSFNHSKLHIMAEIQNTGRVDANNVNFELVYKPIDYLIGPTVEIKDNSGPNPVNKIKPGEKHKKVLNFIVNIYDFFPIGPFPVDEVGEFKEMEFYIIAQGDNTNQVKPVFLSFIPKEEDDLWTSEVKETVKEIEKPIKVENVFNRMIKKVDLAKVKLFN